MTFTVLIADEAQNFPDDLQEKSHGMVRSKIALHSGNPYPGKDGDKERFTSHEKDPVYWLHISNSYTAFYQIKGGFFMCTI